MKKEILMLIIGILIGAIIATGCFLVLQNNNNQGIGGMSQEGMERPDDMGERPDRNNEDGMGNNEESSNSTIETNSSTSNSTTTNSNT